MTSRGDDSAAPGRHRRLPVGTTRIIALPCGIRPVTILDRGLLAWLILRPEIAVINGERAFPIQRDEDACSPDLDRIIDQRPLFERLHRHLELTKSCIDLLWVFVLAGILFLQRTTLGEERSVGHAFLVGHRRGITGQTPQTVAVAVGQVGRDLDPLSAFGGQCLGFNLKFLGHQTVEQGRGHGGEL